MKQIAVFLFLFIAFCSSSNGQIKSTYNSDILDLGEGKILSSTLNESGDYVIQEFIVEVEKTGKYYLAAWVNSTLDLSGEMLKYSFAVNDTKEEDNFWTAKSYPHAVDFGEKMIDLIAGKNKIYFKTRKPFCPNVEFIKVCQDKLNHKISGEKYDQYIDEISKEKLPDNYTEIKEAAMADELASARLKSEPAPDPQVNYDYELDEDFGYTYYLNIWLSSGTVTFETTGATSDPVMHLFFYGEPTLYTWTNDDVGSGNYNSKIIASITESGLYTVLIRKKSTSVAGTCSLYKNSIRLSSTCAVSGSPIQCMKTVTSGLNWFTADLSGDSHIWLEDQTGNPGKIIEYNDDSTVPSGVSWGNNARIRKYVSTNVRALIVSSHSSWNPTGNCDVYMNCMNSSTSLPIQNDAIMSGDGSNYNCFGWSGGRISKEDPTSSFSPWYGDNDLDSFDNYYQNIDNEGKDCFRYGPPAMRFIRLGDDATDGHIALWDTLDVIVHASVKKPANDQPHGYDWESKDGGDDRVFHPKNAIGGFGSIAYYYIKQGYSYSSESKKSAIIQEKASLSNEKQLLLNKMVNAYSDMKGFEKLYESWKETWGNPNLINHSSTRMHANSNQYGALLEYCIEKGKEIWPVIFNKYLDGEEIIDLLIVDLTHEEYSEVIDSIRYKQNLEARINNAAPSQRTNVVNFITYLLGELEGEFESELKSDTQTDVLTFDKTPSINVYPNPAGHFVNIEIVGIEQTEVVITICDLSGKMIKSVLEEVSGDLTYSINIEDIPNGTYLCKIESSNAVNTIKFSVVK